MIYELDEAHINSAYGHILRPNVLQRVNVITLYLPLS